MDENTFWFRLWRCIFVTTAAALTVSVVTYNICQARIAVEAIQNGYSQTVSEGHRIDGGGWRK